MPSRAVRIISALKSTYRLELKEFASSWVASLGEGPFSVLVVTILSQNCTDIAALRAYQRLRGRIGIYPERIAEASISEMEDSIRVAGLYRNKARGLKRLSRMLAKQGDDFWESLARLPWQEARQKLIALPQVGPKTADVFLAVTREAPVLPVDTHVTRVSKRLGLAPQKGSYEVVRHSLEAHIPPVMRHEAHMLFITLGRQICKARVPLCYMCPVEKLCPYPNKTRLRQTHRSTRSSSQPSP